jgi:2-keto-3-deoxy-L-fuconate dehydrogenase
MSLVSSKARHLCIEWPEHFAGTSINMIDLGSRLKGKTALVSGAAAGIGRASVLRMSAEGAHVVAIDVNEEGLRTLKGGTAITVRKVDVCDGQAVRRLQAECGHIDILFNCAGIVPTGTVLECQTEDWSTGFAINVTSYFAMIKAFLPSMLLEKRGSIINMASVVSTIKGVPQRFCYGATKAAVIGMTKSVAADFVASGVRCNAICPGTVDTPSLQNRLRATGDYAKARREFEQRQPMGRIAHVDEISGLVAFLASDDASFITGQAFAVDGGWSI